MTADSLIRFCTDKGYSVRIQYYNPEKSRGYLPEVGKDLASFYAISIDTYGDLLQPTSGFLVYGDSLEQALERINTVLYEAARSNVF